MNSKRLFFLLSGGLGLLAVATIASVYLGNSMLQNKSAELVKLKLDSQGIEEQQRSLVQAKKDIDEHSELESIAKTVVPQEKDQARTVREIVALARASGIDIANISFPSSSLGDAKSKAKAPAGQSSGGSRSQIESVTGISGLYQMSITVQGSGVPVSYDAFLNFLSRLEQNRRTAQVTTLSVQPSPDDRNRVTFSLVLRVYIKP